MPSSETPKQQAERLKEAIRHIQAEAEQRGYPTDQPMDATEQSFWLECAKSLNLQAAGESLADPASGASPITQEERVTLERMHSCLDTIRLIAQGALDGGPDKAEEAIETVRTITEHASIALVKLLVNRMTPTA